MYWLIYLGITYSIGLYMFSMSGRNAGHGWPVKVAIGFILSPIAVPIVLLVNLLLYIMR